MSHVRTKTNEYAYINVTIRSDQKRLTERDLRIPRAMEIRHLIKKIEELFGIVLCRKKFQVRIVTKNLLLDEGKNLADFLVTNGDLIEIMEDYL